VVLFVLYITSQRSQDKYMRRETLDSHIAQFDKLGYRHAALEAQRPQKPAELLDDDDLAMATEQERIAHESAEKTYKPKKAEYDLHARALEQDYQALVAKLKDEPGNTEAMLLNKDVSATAQHLPNIHTSSKLLDQMRAMDEKLTQIDAQIATQHGINLTPSLAERAQNEFRRQMLTKAKAHLVAQKSKLGLFPGDASAEKDYIAQQIKHINAQLRTMPTLDKITPKITPAEQKAYDKLCNEAGFTEAVEDAAAHQVSCIMVKQPRFERYLAAHKAMHTFCQDDATDPFVRGRNPTTGRHTLSHADKLKGHLQSVKNSQPPKASGVSAKAAKLATLADKVPADIVVGTDTVQQVVTNPALQKAYDDTNGHLRTIRGLAEKVDKYADQLADPTITTQEREAIAEKFATTYSELADAADKFNAFLLIHSGTSSIFGNKAGGGLSDIHQAKLDELAHLNESLMKATGYKMHQLERLSFGLGGTLENLLVLPAVYKFFAKPWYEKGVRNIWRNTIHNADIVGGSDSSSIFGRDHVLHHDAKAAGRYGKEQQGITVNHGWLGTKKTYKDENGRKIEYDTDLRDDDGDRVSLPPDGPDTTGMTLKDGEDTSRFSMIAVAKEALGKDWHRHVHRRSDGSVYIAFKNGIFDFNFAEQDRRAGKIIKILTARSKEFKEWKKTHKAKDDVSATMDTANATPIQATLPSASGTATTPVKPSAPPTTPVNGRGGAPFGGVPPAQQTGGRTRPTTTRDEQGRFRTTPRPGSQS
jgi:hypothetical protein